MSMLSLVIIIISKIRKYADTNALPMCCNSVLKEFAYLCDVLDFSRSYRITVLLS